MGCQCANVPANVKVIRVGESDIGLVDLDSIIRGVFFRKIGDEASLKEELFRKVREKNWIPEDRKDAYAEALLREYHVYARSHQSSGQTEKRTAGGFGRLRRWLDKLRRSRKERKK